jgi:hypothetical protein
VLPFVRYDVINDAEKFLHFDFASVFFRDFAHKGMHERLAEFDTAAWEFPPVPFVPCQRPAFGEEDPALRVKDDRAHAHADIVNTTFHIMSSGCCTLPKKVSKVKAADMAGFLLDLFIVSIIIRLYQFMRIYSNAIH